MAFERDYSSFTTGQTPYSENFEDEWGGEPFPAGEKKAWTGSYSHDPYGYVGKSEGYNQEGYGSAMLGEESRHAAAVDAWLAGRYATPSSVGLTGGLYDTSLKWPTTTPTTPSGTGSAQTPFRRSFGDYPFFIPSNQRTTTTRNLIPENIPIPQMGALPEMKLPERNEERIRSLTQGAAGPGLRGLRTQIREAQGKFYENPNVRRMTLRDALAGYGLGLENVMAGARKQAMAEYEAEYQPKLSKAQMEYQAEMNRINTQYQAAWKDYMNRVAKQTTVM